MSAVYQENTPYGSCTVVAGAFPKNLDPRDFPYVIETFVGCGYRIKYIHRSYSNKKDFLYFASLLQPKQRARFFKINKKGVWKSIKVK